LLGAVPVTVPMPPGDWSERLDVIARHRPAYTMMFGQHLHELDALARTHDLRQLFSCFKAVAFTGEPLGAVMKRKMTEEWGLNVFLIGSAGDNATAWECDLHDGMHMPEDCVLVENVEAEGGSAVEDRALGELVTTTLDNATAPLIRYRTDDLGYLTAGACGCGRTQVRHWPVGRKGDEVRINGRTVLPVDVWRALEQAPETETAVFQMICPTKDLTELRMRVGYDPQITTDLADLESRLRDLVREAIGVEPQIELHTEQDMMTRAVGGVKSPPRVVKE
jgi:phenylacetate-CoA ligase